MQVRRKAAEEAQRRREEEDALRPLRVSPNPLEGLGPHEPCKVYGSEPEYRVYSSIGI